MDKKLLNSFKLSGNISVFIPTVNGSGESIDNAEYVKACAQLFFDCFNGATTSPVLNHWVTTEGKGFREKSTIVFAYCQTDVLAEHFGRVIEFCGGMKAELSLENVPVEINGEMYFV
ncbi:hypothetical protein [Acetanaerobacterium elongatum]|uniref:Uncharacterized protein n=1 Tax=Acetanaerobacterium elongatum TaxID=258515 RepID=A0A1G9YWB4_9FIRM|nr:hypothetical protein [Acetanaerobacterium elongatum]SDN13448.1 hypothetical protein SAMN05192585_1124 [Acetanaerobacterium elongatum]